MTTPEFAPPPVLVVMLDGLGDRPWPVLGGLTPLAAARTPNLDALAAAGATGILHSLGRGRAPGTELAHFVLLGHDEHDFPGRAVFEAAGAGIELEPGRIALHAILVTVRREPDGALRIVERYPAGGIEAAPELIAAISEFGHSGISMRLHHTRGEQAILVLDGPASADVTDTDPHNNGWLSGSVHALRDAADPDAAERTAAALTAYLHHAYAELRRATGTAEDDVTSPFLLLKWVARARSLPTFAENTGMSGCIVSSAGVLEGLAAGLGIAHVRMPVLPELAADTRARIDAAASLLAEGTDFVIAHSKAPDEAGHLKDPLAKRDAIAAIDAGLAGLAERRGLPPGTIVIVTGDHGTPAGTTLIHSGDPVSIAVLADAVRPDEVTAFDDLACAHGSLGHVSGADFMPMVLNWRGTARYTGGRLTPHTGQHWPADYEPFRVEGAPQRG